MVIFIICITFLLYNSANGFADISAKVPDTITTWEANAYALNAQTGLGVAPVTSNVSIYLAIHTKQQPDTK